MSKKRIVECIPLKNGEVRFNFDYGQVTDINLFEVEKLFFQLGKILQGKPKPVRIK